MFQNQSQVFSVLPRPSIISSKALRFLACALALKRRSKWLGGLPSTQKDTGSAEADHYNRPLTAELTLLLSVDVVLEILSATYTDVTD
jgi:hypothetical protein